MNDGDRSAALSESSDWVDSFATISLHERPLLRRTLRRQRNTLASSTRREASLAVMRRILRLRWLHPGARVALYDAFDGELDLAPVMRLAARRRCAIYTPRIRNLQRGRMDFVEVSGPPVAAHARSIVPRQPFVGRYRYIDARDLDVVLVPIVAFDMHGWRLGFGAGFYDRKFSFRRRAARVKPLLVGVGYEFQRVGRLEPGAWDVPLDAVVTERALYRCRRR